jgi:carboxypeptidase PM20D1
MRPSRALAWASALLLGLVAVLAGNSLRLESRQPEVSPVPPGPWNADTLALRLAVAVRRVTVSGADSAEFLEFHRELARQYPRVFATLPRVEAFGDIRLPEAALLLEWPGTNPALEPVLLLAHQDVVPVEAETESAWLHPPFAGVIADGYLWGRGTMDDKGSLLAILEAVEVLLEEGFAPERGIFLGFGHDEETRGEGARAMARLLQARGVRLAYVLDEGLAVTHGFLPGVSVPVALIGIAEKGAASVELSVEAEGGHSSMPPRRTVPGRLAEAVSQLERRPMPARLDGATRRLFEWLAPEMEFPAKAVFANLWLFGPWVTHRLAGRPATDAAVRTSTAITWLESGVKENVLPGRARAVVNFRILPGDDVNAVLAHVGRTVDTTQVHLRVLEGAREPSPISDPSLAGYGVVARTVREVFPEALVAPGLVLGGTDSRSFTEIAEAVYRFGPLHFRLDDGKRLYGVNERVRVDELPQMARFYHRLLMNSRAAFPP